MGILSFISKKSRAQTDAKPRKKKSARRRLYDLHTWVGFHLAVIMAVVLFTGTFATVSNELDWLTQHDMRVSPDGEKEIGRHTSELQSPVPISYAVFCLKKKKKKQKTERKKTKHKEKK